MTMPSLAGVGGSLALVLSAWGAIAPVAATTAYTVQPGDTLTAIAARTHTSLPTLLALNPLPDPDWLVVGQSLHLPPAKQPPERRKPLPKLSKPQLVSLLPNPQLPKLDRPTDHLPNPVLPAPGYRWPAQGILTSGFGWRWGRLHRGIDIAAAIGTPIVAAAAGTVVQAGWHEGGYGNFIEIAHADGSRTRYAHNQRLWVRVGQSVAAGQQIAAMGSTGFSTGPHLHFELHPPGQSAVNPIAYLPPIALMAQP